MFTALLYAAWLTQRDHRSALPRAGMSVVSRGLRVA